MITKRAVLIGALLIVANSYWLAYVEMLWHTAHLTHVNPSVNAVCVILLITWINIIIRRVSPAIALSQKDLITIYSMLAVGCAFSGHDCIPRLMGVIPYAFRFATPENDWAALLFRHLPNWLVVSDAKAVKDFFEGEVGFFTDEYLRYWIKPILSWSVVIFLLMLICLLLTSLLRRQWVTQENLAYPTTQIPLAITENAVNIFRDRLLWIGFSIAAGINIFNGIAFFFPPIPSIPVGSQGDGFNLTFHLLEKPWNALGNVPLRMHPYLIGLGFLLPLDLAFSCLFFYLVKKIQLIIGSIVGVVMLPGYPFAGEQGAGALLALLIATCWNGKKHFVTVIDEIIRPTPKNRINEPISYRWMVVALCISSLLLIGFCLKGGMSLWACLAFITIYLLIVVGLTRMRAELGPPMHSIGFVTPQYLMISIFGARSLKASNLTLLSLMNWLSGAHYAAFRTHPMPEQMEAFKMAERTGIKNRTMLIVLVIACAVGIKSGLTLYPYIIYKEGIAAVSEQIHSGGLGTYTYLASGLVNPKTTDWIAVGVLSSTCALNLGIMFLRARFVWCPLHPAGYVIGLARGTADEIWFPLLIAMTSKWLLLNHGGVRAYRRAVPFFIGLVLGEALIGCFWPMISLFLRSTVYSWI